MDSFINSSIEKQTIYEIYRACRLCGAGAGYKMPIMQNVVHLDGAEVELRQKIRECVQIEVHQEDKMPPLICELCVDKVNDFYEFLEMCRQTNNRTRLRLGLPLQTMSKGAPDAGDCILGVTEPVYLNEDSNESLLKPRARNKGKFAKEAENFKKNKWQNEVRPLRSKHVSPPPQRSSKRSREEDMSLSKLQKTRSSMAMPKSILRKERENKVEEDWSPTRSKRSRDSRDIKLELPKRVKIVEKAVTSKPSVKSDFKCKTCKIQFNSNKALTNHMRTHNRPQPKYKSTSKQEKSFFCSKCQKDFQSKLGLDRHKCISANKCGNCGRHITNVRNLANHERACRSKNEFKISPKLLKQLRPIQIRVKRCDQILKKVGDSYDVSGVDCNFGLDKNCIYPYLRSLRIKTEPSYMVNIHNTIDEFDLNQDYVHWDSDSCESDLEISDLREKNVETLAKLSLRTIFSHKFLGKVPKRKRRVKPHKAHDSLLNFDSDVRLGIDNIINSLDNDRNVNDTKDNDNDSLFGDDKTPAVSNDDFDSLFTSTNDSESNLSGDMRKSDEKCEIRNKINEIEDKNITEVNNDNVTKLESNDTIENTQENVESSESSEVVTDTVNISSKNNDNEEHTDKESLINNKTIDDSEVKDNEEIILINNDKVDSNEEQSCNSTNNEMTERTDNVIKNNESVLDSETEKHNEINDKDQDNNIPVSKSDIPIALVPNIELSGVNDENNDSPNNDNTVNDPPVNVTLKNNDNKIDKALHVNGDDKLDLDDLEDISDSEMDDSRLMDAIDEQIGEKKIDTSEVDEESSLSREISVVKSTDLESISSEELPNE